MCVCAYTDMCMSVNLFGMYINVNFVCVCVCVCGLYQSDSPRLPSQRLGITDFRGRHHWAGATRLLMTASNLCRGPVNGSQSVRVCIRECVCVCVCVCVCLYKPHSPQTQRASASFSCGCVCVTSPVDPAGQSFYTAALSTLYFPTQHGLQNPLRSCSKLNHVSARTRAKTRE